MTIAGTGSRKLVMNQLMMGMVIEKMCQLLKKAPDGLCLISGMAEGFDEALARAAIIEKIPFIAAVPHRDYGRYYWGCNSLLRKDRLREFEWLCGQAAEVHVICKSLYVGGQHANFVRNEWMVDNSDKMWAYNKTSTGTKHCVEYARSKGKRIFEVTL